MCTPLHSKDMKLYSVFFKNRSLCLSHNWGRRLKKRITYHTYSVQTLQCATGTTAGPAQGMTLGTSLNSTVCQHPTKASDASKDYGSKAVVMVFPKKLVTVSS